MSDQEGTGEDEPLISRAQLALIFGVSENTVDKWRAKGMPVEEEGGNGRKYGYLHSDCAAWLKAERARAAEEKAAADDFVAQKRMEFLGKEASDPRAGLTPAQMRELAQAELAYMQAAKQRGALVPVEDVEEVLDTCFTAMRAGMDALPDWAERQFGLSPEDVQRAISYCDGILKEVREAIQAAALGDDPTVLDHSDGGLF